MGDGFEADPYARAFPEEDRHVGFALPAIVRASYEEAVKCERAKVWMAAAVMVGRALEAVCKDYDPMSKTMFGGLLSNGAISQELYDWANALRALRNNAAHATETTTIFEQDAVEALDFLQSILEILYELRPKFIKMQQRQSKIPK
jgi:hypothetical protein